MINILSAVVFGTFAALCALAAATRRKSHASALIAYTLIVVFIVGAVPIDLWPFADWPLIAAYHKRDATNVHITAVDRDGIEREIDARAWGSLSMLELAAWLDGPFRSLSARDKSDACAFLLERIERARQDAIAHAAVRSPSPLASPYFILTTPFWDDGIPPRPFVALRIYREAWDLEQRLRNPQAFSRQLLYEYRRPDSRS